MQFVVSRPNEDTWRFRQVDTDASAGSVQLLDDTLVPSAQAPGWVAELESSHSPRWVWADSARIYPELLTASVRVDKAYDLRLARAIIQNNQWTTHDAFFPRVEPDATESASWRRPAPKRSDALFEAKPRVEADELAEYRRQHAVLATATAEHRGRLTYLLAAESAGALIGAEMTFAGIPWDAKIHDQILSDALGPRPAAGQRPAKLETLAYQIRDLLEAPALNPDSPKDLLKALQRAGLPVKSTAKWEIKDHKHPVVEPLLEYKRLQRMMTANGWTWMDEWIRNGRFRPVYVPGGVVTGRWGADGGGALQLPHFVRPAAVADPGWCFVVADAAQLEPRILAAMSGDHAMAQASAGHDLYHGIADAGVVESRSHAKFGMLGAMYGGTTGVSAQVLPKFRVAFPRAMALVESAARAGEQGGTVHTWLGRTSAPGNFASSGEGEDASSAQDRRTRARSYGRFTRNFICQGTAAEWALLWMTQVRSRLRDLPRDEGSHPITGGAHLVFFLHDEILIHTPQHLAEQVAEIVHESAKVAGSVLFGKSEVEFPVTTAVNVSYANPKD